MVSLLLLKNLLIFVHPFSLATLVIVISLATLVAASAAASLFSRNKFVTIREQRLKAVPPELKQLLDIARFVFKEAFGTAEDIDRIEKFVEDLDNAMPASVNREKLREVAEWVVLNPEWLIRALDLSLTTGAIIVERVIKKIIEELHK